MSVIDLQNYFDTRKLGYKIEPGIIQFISQESFKLWQNKAGEKQVNKLITIQLY